MKTIKQNGNTISIGNNGMQRDSNQRKPRYELIPADYYSFVQDYSFIDTDVNLYNITIKLFQVNEKTTLPALCQLLGNIIQYDIYINKNSDLISYLNENILHYWTALAYRLSDGAEYYGVDNWKKARGREEYSRFIESFIRHSFAILTNKQDEEHCSGVLFNLMGIHYMHQQGYIVDENNEYEKGIIK